ncbi:hypothetical protein NKG94_23380 [Micromonospora sp. M12]
MNTTTRHGAVAAEWTKLSSVRSTWWTALAGLLVMAASAGQLAIYAANDNTNDDPTDDLGIVTVGSVLIDSVEMTQYVVLALGLLAITAEFTSGTIRTTLQCTRPVAAYCWPRPRWSAWSPSSSACCSAASVPWSPGRCSVSGQRTGRRHDRRHRGGGDLPGADRRARAGSRCRATERGAHDHRAPRHPDDRAAVPSGAGHRRAEPDRRRVPRRGRRALPGRRHRAVPEPGRAAPARRVGRRRAAAGRAALRRRDA